ncbi:PH domain-containing protein [Saccharothrix australiensis]|uniref:PH (Pleckstrin Homology) domain-containing protein n=1 Tax=Saccharothrix australiensis TaxID=2072 RepID=A0A495WCJ5_9PSEU|nr:PH domain-containing protein [Saccharothrix australiensis]RKT57528.1 PH (Pleckstrin Homology) domain-containing protein [Saccharothrix australiensis]
MAYPDDLLRPGEHVVLHRRPHWKVLLAPVLALLLVVGGGAWLAGLVSGLPWTSTARAVLAAVVLLLVAWLTLAPALRWRTTHFVVTTDRVMYREGVLKRTGLDIPLARIDGVRFEHGPFDRVLGCGTLFVESASHEPLEFDDIPGVERVHAALHRGINDNPDDDFRPEDRVIDGRA